MTHHPGRRALAAGLLALPALGRPRGAGAQTEAWPNRPIRVIYPFAPGAGDLVPRLISEHLPALLGQGLVIEHKPGANTMIGARPRRARRRMATRSAGWPAARW